MQNVQINAEVAIREVEFLAETWRQRSLGLSQLAYTQQIRIEQLEEELRKRDEPVVVQSENID